jgi:hypothetical protein
LAVIANTHKIQTFTFGIFVAVRELVSDRRKHMPTLPDKEAQARLLRQIVDINEKKRKLEDDLRTLDSRNKSLMEIEARKDIEAYKARHHRSNVAISTMTHG